MIRDQDVGEIRRLGQAFQPVVCFFLGLEGCYDIGRSTRLDMGEVLAESSELAGRADETERIQDDLKRCSIFLGVGLITELREETFCLEGSLLKALEASCGVERSRGHKPLVEVIEWVPLPCTSEKAESVSCKPQNAPPISG
jgi:hypothetical protein